MFSDWIKSLEKSGVKLYEIADVIDVTYQTIQCYRDRNNYPTVKNLIKLSEHYNIPIETMLYFNESRPETAENDHEKKLLEIFRQAPDHLRTKLLDDFSKLVSEETKKPTEN